MTTGSESAAQAHISRRRLVGLAGVATIPIASRADAASASRWIEESFYFEMPEDTVYMTNSGRLPVAPSPPGIPLLTEPRLQTSLVFGTKVRNAHGEVIGLAIENEELLPDSDLPAGVKHSRTVWSVYVPGRGTIAFDQFERTPDDVAAAFRQAAQSGQPWVGELDAVPTIGPGPRGKGVIVGGSGAFAGALGSATERGVIRKIDPVARELTGSQELRFRYRRPRVTTS